MRPENGERIGMTRGGQRVEGIRDVHAQIMSRFPYGGYALARTAST
jgi:hypothetical protein